MTTQKRAEAIKIIGWIIKNLTDAKDRIERTQDESYDSIVDDLTGYAQEDLNKLREIVT